MRSRQAPRRKLATRQRHYHRPAVGITMFGVTTATMQGIVRPTWIASFSTRLELADINERTSPTQACSQALSISRRREVADMFGGQRLFPLGTMSFGAAIGRTDFAMDWIGQRDGHGEFQTAETVPDKFASRQLVIEPEHSLCGPRHKRSSAAIGEWMGARRPMEGRVRLLLPEKARILERPGKACPAIQRPTQPCSRRLRADCPPDRAATRRQSQGERRRRAFIREVQRQHFLLPSQPASRKESLMPKLDARRFWRSFRR